MEMVKYSDELIMETQRSWLKFFRAMIMKFWMFIINFQKINYDIYIKRFMFE